jgi:hypothetical protein
MIFKLTLTVDNMNEFTINEVPYHEGGKYGSGQEMYYARHRIRLWEWYCKSMNVPFHINETYLIYKQKKEILKSICLSLDLSDYGTNKVLIARLDRYEFTPNQLQQLTM